MPKFGHALMTLFSVILLSAAGIVTNATSTPQTPQTQSSLEEQVKQRLLVSFNRDKASNPAAAYATAIEYGGKYPNDESSEAQYLKKWLAVYEKLKAATPAETTTTTGTPSAEPSNSSLTQTYKSLRDNLDANSLEVVQSFEVKGKKRKLRKHTFNNKTSLINFEGCTISLQVLELAKETSKYYAERHVLTFDIPLSEVDPASIKVFKTGGNFEREMGGKFWGGLWEQDAWQVELGLLGKAQHIQVAEKKRYYSGENVFGASHGFNQTSETAGTQDWLIIPFISEDAANRASQSLMSALNMCGKH